MKQIGWHLGIVLVAFSAQSGWANQTHLHEQTDPLLERSCQLLADDARAQGEAAYLQVGQYLKQAKIEIKADSDNRFPGIGPLTLGTDFERVKSAVLARTQSTAADIAAWASRKKPIEEELGRVTERKERLNPFKSPKAYDQAADREDALKNQLADIDAHIRRYKDSLTESKGLLAELAKNGYQVELDADTGLQLCSSPGPDADVTYVPTAEDLSWPNPTPPSIMRALIAYNSGRNTTACFKTNLVSGETFFVLYRDQTRTEVARLHAAGPGETVSPDFLEKPETLNEVRKQAIKSKMNGISTDCRTSRPVTDLARELGTVEADATQAKPLPRNASDGAARVQARHLQRAVGAN